jgi:hypothetical protein
MSIRPGMCFVCREALDIGPVVTIKELAPYPMSLFNEQGMRKGTKSTLYSAFTPLSSPKPIDSSTNVVLDGGYLLHKVV